MSLVGGKGAGFGFVVIMVDLVGLGGTFKKPYRGMCITVCFFGGEKSFPFHTAQTEEFFFSLGKALQFCNPREKNRVDVF